MRAVKDTHCQRQAEGKMATTLGTDWVDYSTTPGSGRHSLSRPDDFKIIVSKQFQDTEVVKKNYIYIYIRIKY